MGGWMDRLMQPELLRAVQQLKPLAEEAGLTPAAVRARLGAARAQCRLRHHRRLAARAGRENAAASGVIVDTQLFLRAEQIIDEALAREPA